MAKILIIDDVTGVRRSIAGILERAGHEVLEAEDGAEGVALAAIERPDLVLVDMLMPQKDGLETLDALNAALPGLKTIAMSGGGSLVGADDALSVAAERASARMRKPFETGELAECVKTLLGEAA